MVLFYIQKLLEIYLPIQLKRKRDNNKVKTCLVNLDTAAKDGSNLMPFVIKAVENSCTPGEIADCLRDVFGEYKQIV